MLANHLEHLSLRQVEEATGISAATLSRRLRGVGPGFKDPELVLLALLIGKPLSELVAEAEQGAA